MRTGANSSSIEQAAVTAVPAPRTGIEPAAFAWAAALVLSAVCSEDRAGSMPRLTKALFPFLAGLAAITARDERASRRALAVLLAATGVVAVIGTLDIVFGEIDR